MKKILISSLIILLGLPAFAEDYEQMSDETMINNMFQNTVNNFYNNPASMTLLLNEIKRTDNEDIFEILKEMKLDNIDFNNKELIAFLSNKVETDPKFLEKILLDYGQSKAFAAKNMSDEQIKDYVIKKTQTSSDFRRELYPLLSRKDKKIVSGYKVKE